MELRKGKWTKEEETYAARLIRDFRAGISPLHDGKSLRAHLAEKLYCEPMRITKKFSRTDCIGKISFRPASLQMFPLELREIAISEVEDFRRIFLLRELQSGRGNISIIKLLPKPTHICTQMNPPFCQEEQPKMDEEVRKGVSIFSGFVIKVNRDKI
jgi:hypothetical protein